MKKTHSLFAITILTLVLTACHNRTGDYVNAQNNPPLKTPPGVNNATFTDHNPIPKSSTAGTVTPPSLVPPGLVEDEAAAAKAASSAQN